ncbi:FtsX-like permease family protein [Kitasatospora azatica]|uniref:ABC transporter permease n=1 Tax=Kitasatospora azatica TaxID=58347 RepID=UPI00068F0FCE|nr:ABC transporter permease [Kitasatospora azatica]
MSAVWRASRAAVKRRRLQTLVIGLVVFLSATTLVVALGLLDATTAPFERVFNGRSGAQLTATFDPAKATGAQLAETARRPGVTAAAGPFGEAVVTLTDLPVGNPSQPFTLVGRTDPGGPVDRLDVWAGRWATAPGEVVLNLPRAVGTLPDLIGSARTVTGHGKLTVVGVAYSVTQSADGWVTPDQLAELHPGAVQMLYRFAHAGTAGEVDAGKAVVTGGLPAGSLVTALSYLTIEQQIAAGPGAYVPLLVTFGVLGLIVAVLIVGNVISGAVVSGFRHIGVLKALGFTPNQVVAVYLTMLSVPAVVGCVLGTVLGNLAAQPLVTQTLRGFGGSEYVISPWVDVVTLLGLPVVVVLAALVPALRAHRLSAARAISAGSAPRPGRALRVQRRLAGSRLPRSVSLGLGLPFARPGRTALTLAAVLLGAATVTLTTGLTSTMTKYGDAIEGSGHRSVEVYSGKARMGQTEPRLSSTDTEAMLRGLPGAVHVMADSYVDANLVGFPQTATISAMRGDSAVLGPTLLKGRWFSGPGEIVASAGFLKKRGLAVGDHLTVDLGGRQGQVAIVGTAMIGAPDLVFADWRAVQAIAPDDQALTWSVQYEVQLAPGTDYNAYMAAVAAADPGLYPHDARAVNAGAVTVISTASILTLLLGTVTALGVFNTVVLNTRERRRDLGMLKSIGMTPRQVTVMMVTSMAGVGLVGGLLGTPIGVLAHQLIVPLSFGVGGVQLPGSMLHIWSPPLLAALALAGMLIAALGALLPARSAARLTIAEVLRSE